MPERDGSIVYETYFDYRTRSYLRCISFCGLRGSRIPRDRVRVTLQRSFERVPVRSHACDLKLLRRQRAVNTIVPSSIHRELYKSG